MWNPFQLKAETMHFEVSGEGSPILLVHGFCETSAIWGNLRQEFAKKHQVILIDLPGFGKSPLTIPDLSLTDVATSIHHLLKGLDISACFIIGHSLGGYVAMAYASKYPESVLGIGLFHSTAYPDSREKKEIREKGIEHVSTHGMSSFSKGFVPNLFYAKNHSLFVEEMEGLKKEAAKTPLATFIAYSRAMKNRMDTTNVFSKLEKPVFIIAGENDNAVPIAQSLELISQINNGDSLVLSETGHMGFIEKEAESTEFIKKFLENYSI